jgi:hypothetical protein
MMNGILYLQCKTRVRASTAFTGVHGKPTPYWRSRQADSLLAFTARRLVAVMVMMGRVRVRERVRDGVMRRAMVRAVVVLLTTRAQDGILRDSRSQHIAYHIVLIQQIFHRLLFK